MELKIIAALIMILSAIGIIIAVADITTPTKLKVPNPIIDVSNTEDKYHHKKHPIVDEKILRQHSR